MAWQHESGIGENSVYQICGEIINEMACENGERKKRK